MLAIIKRIRLPENDNNYFDAVAQSRKNITDASKVKSFSLKLSRKPNRNLQSCFSNGTKEKVMGAGLNYNLRIISHISKVYVHTE